MSEYGFADDVPGIIFKKVKAFETSPVFIGAGETNLVTVKSLNNEGKGMDEDKTQEENSPVEVNKENKDNEVSKMPTAEEIADVLLAKQKAAEEAEKEASKTDVDRAKEQLEKLTDDQKKELGIPSGGSSTTPKVYAEAKKNGGTDDLMKAANDRQESILKVASGLDKSTSFMFNAVPEEVMKATLAGIGSIQDRVTVSYTHLTLPTKA